MELIKGSATSIPAELLNRKARGRNDYEWNKLSVGDHYVFENEDAFPTIRASMNNYKKGNDNRAPITLVSRSVEKRDDSGKVTAKLLEVWRLDDPTPAVAATSPEPAKEPEPEKNKDKK